MMTNLNNYDIIIETLERSTFLCQTLKQNRLTH